ncbi:MAG TPA: hypothetical protein PLI09_18675 [Candidatus Hydrogenedentes bacterium]|nr:hypothetical protein [Candidatus Hydrogenedentota bacterium]
MLRILFAIILLCAGAAFAQQQGTNVKATELPPPASADTQKSVEPQDTPQPSLSQTAAAASNETSNVEIPAEQRIIRPSEIPSDKRSSKRVAAFWFIVPGK